MQNRTSNHNRTGPRAAEAYVTLIRAGEEVGHHDLDPARTTTVGRHPLCDIILDDTLISRTHCEILHTNEGWIVRDLGSRKWHLRQMQTPLAGLAAEGRTRHPLGQYVTGFPSLPVGRRSR